MQTEQEKPKTIQPGTTDSDLTVYHFPGNPGENQIRFQNGAMELGRNGATTEEVLDCLIAHINYFQQGKYACRENALMITKLEEAKHWALHRKQLREAQGVKGKSEPHK